MSWTIQELTALATGYWQSATLAAALELKLFEALDGGPATAGETAAALSTSARHTAALMDALCGLGLLEKHGDRYRLESGAAVFLSRSSPTCLLEALRFNVAMAPLWAQLARGVREGAPVLPPTAHLGDDPARTRSFVLGMHSRALAMAPAVLHGIHPAGVRRLLDVASGPGTFSMLLAERHPGLHVTLFDLPPVLGIARELVRARGLEARFEFAPGDYRADPLPGGCDAALYCGALHQEDERTAPGVLAKLFEALAPGGMLWVVDMMLAPSRTEPVFSTLFALNMMLVSPIARTFTGQEVLALAADAGFRDGALHPLAGSPYWLVAARKPV